MHFIRVVLITLLAHVVFAMVFIQWSLLIFTGTSELTNLRFPSTSEKPSFVSVANSIAKIASKIRRK
jgi:hypothetical protein